MANFDAQVIELVGSSWTTDQDAVNQFITEGANEVINAMPRAMQERVAEETPVTTGTTTSEGHKVLYMLRNDGAIDQPCRRISANKRGRAADSSDMEYATTSDPAYYVKDGKFNILPSGAGLLVSVPTYSQSSVIDASGNATITNFPNEAEYLVVLYAAMKALQQVMNGKTSDLPDDIVIPASPTVPTLTDFNDYWTIGDFPDSDPGVFGTTAVDPSAPDAPSFTTPDISSVTISNLGVPPTYTSPTITSTAGSPDDLSDMFDSDWTSLDYDFDDENIDFATWFQVVGDYIQNQEDTELAQMQMQKISTYINAYQSSMQNRLNIFNDENSEYQVRLQESIQQVQIDAREAEQESSLKLQKENQEYLAKLQKYNAEVGKYQADVSKEVQEYTQKLSRYQLELTTVYQAWSKTEADKLQKYSNELQNYQTEVNKSIQDFNTKLQKHTTDYGWLQSQYQQLSADYKRGIQLLRGDSGSQ
jgi:hypothetical protein